MSRGCQWCRPTDPVELPQAGVHIWQARLDVSPAAVEALWTLLAPDEQLRSQRYIQPVQHRFVVARGILRQLLGHYLQVPATTIELSYGPQGKPLLQSEHSDTLQFNLSHSQDLALYAFSWDWPVGVDIEWLRSRVAWSTIARQYFSPAEQSWLWSLAPDIQLQAFFQQWTVKEACIKAQGGSVFQGLRQVTVPPVLDLSGSWHPIVTPDQTGYWLVQGIDPAVDHVAAVALAGANLLEAPVPISALSCQFWQWTEQEQLH